MMQSRGNFGVYANNYHVMKMTYKQTKIAILYINSRYNGVTCIDTGYAYMYIYISMIDTNMKYKCYSVTCISLPLKLTTMFCRRFPVYSRS